LHAGRASPVVALDRRGRWQRRRASARRFLVGFLVVLFAVLLPITVVVGWAHNTVLNTSGWVRTVGPIASDPAVTAAISAQVTEQVFTALDVQQQVSDALPSNAAFLAGPITNGAKDFVQSGVNKVLQSEQFQSIWISANEAAHEQLVKFLRGNTTVLTTSDGQVVLNLVPLVNAALQQIESFVSGVVGKPVDLPTISADEVPAEACQKISTALGRSLPETCGQIPLFPADKLTEAQRFVEAFDRLTILLVVLTPAVAGAAMWFSKRRRRTLLQLIVGSALGLVVARRATWWLQDSLVNTGKPENKAARQAILGGVTHAFFTLSGWILVGLAAALVVTLVTGPYPWARTVRRWGRDAAHGAKELAAATVGKVRDDAAVAWVRSHLGVLRLGGMIVAVILMMVISVSFLGFLILVGVLAAYELWLQRLQQTAPPPSASVSPAPDG